MSAEVTATTDTDRINLRDEVFAICERLGLNPNDVRRLAIGTDRLTAEVFKHDEEGRKFIDSQRNEPGTEVRTFRIRTY